MKKLIEIGILTAIIFMILCSTLASCSVVRKSVSRTDSTIVRHIDSAKVLKSDSVSSKKVDSTYERETVIEFDSTGRAFIDWLEATNPNDFNPLVEKLKPFLNVSVKKITIKERGVLVKNEETKVSKIDSVKVKTEEKITVKKVDKQKKVSRFQWWWLLVLVLPTAFYFLNKKYKFI